MHRRLSRADHGYGDHLAGRLQAWISHTVDDHCIDAIIFSLDYLADYVRHSHDLIVA